MPIKVFRVEDCSASIWDREVATKNGPYKFYSVMFERSYKDRDGTWKYTKSFDLDGLGKVVKLCQLAGDFMQGLEEQRDAAQ